ncbi:MAG TPA: SDR family NAD(P)-dependent oxidoreductase, partial [Candidatus Competibacteraceae bacterium]|nr:SDR family NAD(P)-dependent oxidoreductase [Candidatus Competibacteraceae bacterium]
MQPLKNQVALITGGGRGIGAATAEALARKGAQVIVASRTEAELTATVAALRAAGLKASLIVLDVADDAAVAAAFSRIAREWGRLDILVNNAAILL